MRHLHRPLLIAVAAVGFAALAAGDASAANDNWKKYGADCDDTAFKQPADADLKVIGRCVRVWEAYQDVSSVKDGGYKDRVVAAMTRLYIEGSDKDETVARVALRRLGVTNLPDKAAKPATAASEAPKDTGRKRFAPAEPSAKDIKAAEKFFKAGLKQYTKKKYDAALVQYLKMVDAAPGYPKGHYNVACIYALQGDDANMGTYLQNLADMSAGGNDEAGKLLKRTRTDTDFDGVRDSSARYKELTGYAKIKVLNASGELGEENADNLLASLKKLNYNADGVDESSKPRKNPIIWYAEHARAAAFIVKELLGHPKTEVYVFTTEQLKGYDVVVTWADEVKKGGEPKVYVADPADAEKKLDQLARKEDEILRKPEEVADEVDDALGKPEEVKDRIDKNLERPGKAIDRAEKTVDKVKGLFD